MSTKNDDGKLPLDLLPFDVLEAAAEVLRLGAVKYAPREWEQGGFAWSRLLAATLRHLFAWGAGRRIDPEWSKSHLHHALVSLMFLVAHELRGLGTDDQPWASATITTSADDDAPLFAEGQRVMWVPRFGTMFTVTLVARLPNAVWEAYETPGGAVLYVLEADLLPKKDGDA
jgi:hypothetical protein